MSRELDARPLLWDLLSRVLAVCCINLLKNSFPLAVSKGNPSLPDMFFSGLKPMEG